MKSLHRIFKDSFALYPFHAVTLVLAIVFSGLAESFGILTILPIIELGLDQAGLQSQQASSSSPIDGVFLSIFDYFNIHPSMVILLAFMVVMITIKSVSSLIATAYVGIVSTLIATNLRKSLVKSLLSASWRFFTSQSVGRFSNAISTEVNRAANSYIAAWNMVAASLQILLFMIASAAVSFQTLLCGIGAGLFINILLHWTVRVARQAGSKETQLMNDLISLLTDSINGIKPLKAMGIENRVLPMIEGQTNDLRQAQARQAFASAAQATLPEPLMALMLALLAYFALNYMQVAIPELAVIAIFFNRMVGRISQVQKYYQMLAHSESAYWSLQTLIRRAESSAITRSGIAPPERLVKGIELQDVSFFYDEKQVLRHFNLFIPARKLSVLIGSSGSGKTTLVDLISGLMEPTHGRILIDNDDLAQIDTRAWSQKIGYVPQELSLFHDTIKDNITLKDQSFADHDVWEALRRCHADDFVRALPEQLETVIGERGSKLSGGQRQRLMIARAMIRKPVLLILDEATTALDPEVERVICDTVKNLTKDVTILAISHQPALQKIADCIIDISQIK
ncbi:MAG: ABC transporter ATP-binding protein/permease [Alphaproteobacteria bacterium]|nr:ABC transporter ATP-binding protein/permease [Alphaproteobacteria bacterium]